VPVSSGIFREIDAVRPRRRPRRRHYRKTRRRAAGNTATAFFPRAAGI
jgi:hypothetical protein